MTSVLFGVKSEAPDLHDEARWANQYSWYKASNENNGCWMYWDFDEYKEYVENSQILDDTANILEEMLGEELEAREGYHRGDYYCSKRPELELYLLINFLFEDERIEPDFPDYQCLLYLHGADKHPEELAIIETRPDIFVRLQEEYYADDRFVRVCCLQDHVAREPSICNLYGIKSAKIDDIARIIHVELSIGIRPKDSEYFGRLYILTEPNGYLYLRYNVLNNGMDLLEADFSMYPLLLHLTNANRYPHYLAAIESRPDIFEKLRSEQF